MTDQNMGAAVRQLRKARHLTLEQLADSIPDYDAGNLSRFERGEQGITMAKLEAIARALGTRVPALYDLAEAIATKEVTDGQLFAASPLTADSGAIAKEPTAPYAALVRGVKRVPVLTDSAAAAAPESAPKLSHASDYIDTTEPVSSTAFGWRVKDNSMAADGSSLLSFQPGMVVIFDPALPHGPGDCVLVRLSNANIAFCQLVQAGGVWYMSFLNRRYAPSPLPGDAVVLGVAVSAQIRVPRGE